MTEEVPSQETQIALIGQRLELHIAACFQLGEENRRILEKMHEENRSNMAAVIAAQAKLTTAFDMAKGGWKLILGLCTLVGLCSSILGWFVAHVTR